MIYDKKMTDFDAAFAFRLGQGSGAVAGLGRGKVWAVEEVLGVDAVEEVHDVLGDVADEDVGGWRDWKWKETF